MDGHARRFNALMTDVFDGLRECYPDVVNDEHQREPLMDAARFAYEQRSEGDQHSSSDYEALRHAVVEAIGAANHAYFS